MRNGKDSVKKENSKSSLKSSPIPENRRKTTNKNRKNRNRKILNTILICFACGLVLFGAGAFLYPAWKTAEFERKGNEAIDSFLVYRESRTAEEPAPDIPEEHERATIQERNNYLLTRRKFQTLWDACVEYNEHIYVTLQDELTDEMQALAPFDVKKYGWDNDVFCYVSIPSADHQYPVYLGGSMYNLSRGAALMGQTSMPIGGENTNAVILGHRTWNASTPFACIEELEPGDKVYIINPWETLTYTVTETLKVLPTDIGAVKIVEGKELLTLVTCAYPNTHRIVVVCERSD